MLGEFEWFRQLPLEVNRQADWYLISSESAAKLDYPPSPVKRRTYPWWAFQSDFHPV